MRSWFVSLPIQLQAALIGSVSSLVVVFLRDLAVRFFFERRREERERKNAALAVYGGYADPLASATTSLFWRLREVFYEPSRAVFLRVEEPITEYQCYKKRSTVYRVAALLGWIRGFRRELSFFTLDARTRLSALEGAIDELESALADGRRVEVRRVEDLVELWGIGSPEARPGEHEKSRASVVTEVEIKSRYGISELYEIRNMPTERQREVCGLAAEVLGKELGADNVHTKVLENNLSQAVEILGVREAWLYRDWQAAIGDLMLEDVSSERRRFEVKGYAAFVEAWGEEGPERRWIELLVRIFGAVDVSRRDGSDARVPQLENTLIATAKLIKAISEVRERPGSVAPGTLEAARQVLTDYQQT